MLVRCKILWLDVQKKTIFKFFLLFAIEMVILIVFWQKEDLGLLGVKQFIISIVWIW